MASFLPALDRTTVALLLALSAFSLFPDLTCGRHAGITRHHKFHIRLQNVTRLCHTKSIVTVNGQFPGPKIVAREGDRVVVQVINHVQNNITIHWHGIRQLRSVWSDGPAYITQCPIQSGQTYVYNFTIIGQRGTLFWHAHFSWLRATVYGPLVILPKRGVPYPFPTPYKEVPIIFGEWFNADPEAIIKEALHTGDGPNVSDAYTINGLPGPLYDCSARGSLLTGRGRKVTRPLGIKAASQWPSWTCDCKDWFAFSDGLEKSPSWPTRSISVSDTSSWFGWCGADTFKLRVKPGKTYLLRLINAALNDELFFSIANHTLTVVEADAVYVKPFQTNILLISPGQTTNVLLKANPHHPNATFFMAARPYVTGVAPFDNSTTVGLLEYQYPNLTNPRNVSAINKPSLPPLKDTSFADNYTRRLRSLANAQFPANVPQTIDKLFFFVVGEGTLLCPKSQTCQGPNGNKFAASINNVSFLHPTTSLLQAHFFGKSDGVYTTDFPTNPLFRFDYTGAPPDNTLVKDGTKVVVLPFNASVELVMQDTSILGPESHPLHLHGFNFFVVGQGFGNYNPNEDRSNFNLVDPIERNTVGVPSGGWVAIRFRADNPGVWFMHCHLETHASWGLAMAWVVLDGDQPNQKLPPPPSDLPEC